MKASEVIDILNDVKGTDCNPDILGISVNKTFITVCYENRDDEIKAIMVDYKNSDLYK